MLLSEAVDHSKKQHPQNPLKGDALLGVPEGKKTQATKHPCVCGISLQLNLKQEIVRREQWSVEESQRQLC